MEGEGMRLLLEAVDGLNLEVFLQPERAHRPADTGLLVPAHRSVGVGVGAVVGDSPRAQAAGELISALAVLTEDIAAQAEDRVIGDVERLVLSLIWHDDQD